MRAKQTERVVVLGGGYAGMIAALRVAGRARRNALVTVVDPKQHFVQRLRLHQVATGQKVAQPPYQKLLGRKVEFIQGWAEAIDLDRKVVQLSTADRSEVPFDRLIYAVGSTVEPAPLSGAAEHAHSVADAPSARKLDHALHYASDGRTVAVVGGGMTGLEVAAEIATVCPRLSVKLVTRGTAGGWLSDRGREYLRSTLARHGVELVEHSEVRGVASNHLQLADGSDIPAGIIVWCGGFRASSLADTGGLDTDTLGRVVVDRTMRSVSNPEIPAAGHGAATPPFSAGPSLRMCCQVAMPTTAHAADVLIAQIKGREPKDVHFGYLHQPISLGRRDGLIQFVDRADQPKDSILTGRPAAIYKELITAGGLQSIKLERRIPGSTKWPFKEPTTPALLEATATAGK
jgi:NADH:ubiquinone reductase (H+-translocating)